MTFFIPNPLFLEELKVDPTFRAHMDLVGDAAKEEARNFAPVLTGALRDSIEVSHLEGGRQRISVGVRYGMYVEFGTFDTPAEPYLRPALDALGLHAT